MITAEEAYNRTIAAKRELLDSLTRKYATYLVVAEDSILTDSLGSFSTELTGIDFTDTELLMTLVVNPLRELGYKITSSTSGGTITISWRIK